MKKVLLATTALLLVSAVSAQAAEPIKLTVGGYMKQWVGFADNKDDTANLTGSNVSSTTYAANRLANLTTTQDNKAKFDTQNDGQITIAGSTKLDNGISVGAEVDLFAFGRQDSRNNNQNVAKDGLAGNSAVKRAFATVSGVFGTLIVGEREDVGYIVHNSAPDVGIGLADGDFSNWIINPKNHRLYELTTAARYDDRANKVSYVTPSLYGLAAAFSYVPDISLSTQGRNKTVASSDVALLPTTTGIADGQDLGGDLYVGGLAYKGEFGGVGIKADFGVGQANIANLRVFQGGTQISYAGFTLGGSLFNRDVDGHSIRYFSYAPGTSAFSSTLNTSYNKSTVKGAALAGTSWDAGLSYATGPYAVSAGYFQDRSNNIVGSNLTSAAADSTYVYMLSGKYIMGPGVAFKTSAMHVDYVSGVKNTANENKGFAWISGIQLDF